jgi:hypothetical protein
VDTRELVATDGDATHAFATTVRVEVTYSDTTSTGMVANGTGDVPPLGPAPPPRYTLTGMISDPAGAGITNARVEVLNGDNAGNATTTNANGAYTLTDLLGGTFRVRASAPGYTTGEQNVTVPDVPRADFTLPRSPTTSACAYTLSATGRINVSFGPGQFGVTVTRTSGDCSWQATTDAGWLTPISATGNGTSNVTYTYASNTSFVGRLATITFTWNGGTAQLQVVQDPEPASFCVVTVSVNGQNPLNNVPAAGGSYTLNITPVAGMPPGLCSSWSASVAGPLTIVTSSSGPGLPATVNFTVSANPGPPARSGLITVTTGSGPGATLTVNQVAGP